MMASEFRLSTRWWGWSCTPRSPGIAERNLAVWTAAGRAVSPARIVCQEATEFLFPHGRLPVVPVQPVCRAGDETAD